jgi:hypothetical protein
MHKYELAVTRQLYSLSFLHKKKRGYYVCVVRIYTQIIMLDENTCKVYRKKREKLFIKQNMNV